jgi:hypothetical protein
MEPLPRTRPWFLRSGYRSSSFTCAFMARGHIATTPDRDPPTAYVSNRRSSPLC